MTSAIRCAAWSLLVLLSGLGPARPGAAAAAQVIDSGTFTLWEDGVRVGEERFVVREERSGDRRVLRMGGEVDLKTDGATFRLRIALEAAGDPWVPRRYEAEIDAERASRILGVLSRDRFRLNTRSDRGEQIRQFLPRPPWLILDRHVMHQHYMAAVLLGDREQLELTTLLPRDGREVRAVVRDHGTQETEIGGQGRPLRHLTVELAGGTTRHLWMEGDRMMKIEIPEENWRAVRADAARPGG